MLTFEELKEEDLSIVAQLYDSETSYSADLDKMKENYESIKDNFFYKMIVVKLDREIVGFAYVNVHQDIFEKCNPFLSVWSVRVKKDYRRKKIGTALFQYIEDLAKTRDCNFICLIAEIDNDIANLFYQNLGYRKENGYVKFLERSC